VDTGTAPKAATDIRSIASPTIKPRSTARFATRVFPLTSNGRLRRAMAVGPSIRGGTLVRTEPGPTDVVVSARRGYVASSVMPTCEPSTRLMTGFVGTAPVGTFPKGDNALSVHDRAASRSFPSCPKRTASPLKLIVGAA
jgi:hypothetical protein